jgi:hypothetical protein
MYDKFLAALTCPACGAVTEEAEIQTHLRGGCADGSAFYIGSVLEPYDLETERLLYTEYALVDPPAPGGPIRLLVVWSCFHCQRDQWAMIEILDGTVRRIDAVTLDRRTLLAANFISELDAELLAAALSGRPDVRGAASVELLRQQLP